MFSETYEAEPIKFDYSVNYFFFFFLAQCEKKLALNLIHL